MFFPIDLSPYPVSPEPLSQPLGSTLPINHDNETAAVQDIIAALMRSHNPSVLVDHLVWSYALPQTRALVEKLRLPTYTSHMGKGAVDEDKEYFVGVYNAQVSCEGVQEAFEGSDLMLSIGTWRTDSNTAFFSRNMPVDKVMDVQVAYTTVSLILILKSPGVLVLYSNDITGQTRKIRKRIHRTSPRTASP